MPAADLVQLAIAFDVPLASRHDSVSAALFDDGPREAAVLAHFLTVPNEFRARLERFLHGHPRAIAYFDNADVERMLQLGLNRPPSVTSNTASARTVLTAAAVIVLVGLAIGIAFAFVMRSSTPRPSDVSEAFTPTPGETATTLIGSPTGTPSAAVSATPARSATPTAKATGKTLPAKMAQVNTPSATISELSPAPAKPETSTPIAAMPTPQRTISARVKPTATVAASATAEATASAPATPTASPMQSNTPRVAAGTPATGNTGLQGTWRINEANVVVGRIVWSGNATVSNSNTIVMDLHKKSVGGRPATQCEQETNLHFVIPISASAQSVSYREINCEGTSSTGEVHVGGVSATRGAFSGTFWQNGMDIGYFDAYKEEVSVHL